MSNPQDEREAPASAYNIGRMFYEASVGRERPEFWQLTSLQQADWVYRAALANQRAEAGQSADERELRRMLCMKYAGAAAYIDDGEAQDNRAMPCIDFMRDSPAEILRKMQVRAAQPEAVPQGGQWTKQQLIDFLAIRRQRLGGSVSEHNHRRLLATLSKADLLVMYERIAENEQRHIPAPPSPQPPAAPNLAALEAAVAHWRLVAETKTTIANRLADDVEALRAKPPAAQAEDAAHTDRAPLGFTIHERSAWSIGVEHGMSLRQPLTDEQVEELYSKANRDCWIEREDYFKAFRHAERAHGIGTAKPAQPEDGITAPAGGGED